VDNKPLVSIIMNCYNSDTYLRDALDSIYGQTYCQWEVIFWDNGSTDLSSEIAKSYDSRIKYFLADTTTPLGEARNLAMKKAKGKYIAFLDCDDLYFEDKLELQVNMMEKDDFSMCYGGAIIIDESSYIINKEPARYQSGNVFPNLLSRYEINMQSVMLRRSILIETGLTFSTDMKYCPDHNLFMEVASRFKVGVINKYVVKYRIVKESLSKKTMHLVSSEIKLTLDAIINRKPDIRAVYNAEFNSAYAKLNYYDAINYISLGEISNARRIIRDVIFVRWEYFALFVILFFPISNNFLLRLLKR